MRRMLLLAALCAGTVLTLASVASAQDVVVQGDGSVTIGGDVGTDCRSFALSVEQGFDLGLTQGQIQSVLEQCEQAGFLSSTPVGEQYNDDVAGAIPTPQPSTPVEGPPSGENNTSVLPDTGGVSGLILMVGVLLLGGGLVVRRIGG